MKALNLSLLIASLAIGSAVTAKDRPVQSADTGKAQLRQALGAFAIAAQSSGPPAKTVDKDQGDDHANPRAILRVCSKDTPAARRSAICPIGVSPE